VSGLNIESRMNKIIDDLEQNIFCNRSDINNSLVFEGIKGSFNCAKVNSKQICPEETKYYENLLNILSDNEFIMTKTMFNQGFRYFNIMKNRKSDIKQFFNDYFYMLRLLLIFNRVDKECCDVCQGDLFYYYENNNSEIIKICGTCSRVFNAYGKIIEQPEFDFRLEKKLELTELFGCELNNSVNS